ncbi:MAG TPA: response regulator, partial [Micromonosporaceae bacterium]|nr:response regulator [Micromonosporaceae bacterium]
ARQLVGSPDGAADRADTVLVIDDSATFRSELRRTLEREGYAVVTAATGEDGLRAAADQRPSAIVVDGVLPGADGATVIRRIRLDAALRHVPCLLLTGSEDPGAELQALDAGADAFVRKDTDTTLVLAKLAAVLRHATTAPGHTGSVHGPKRVLVVDDSPAYVDRVAEALRDDGYDVVPARSGREALELLTSQGVDCIILNPDLPGLSGRETCRRVRATPALRDLPLVMVTADPDREAMLAWLGAGADDCVHKADDLEILKARVRAQMRRKQVQDENRHARDQVLRREMAASEARAARELAATRAALVEELEWKNRELEAFNYAVSHDLRNPVQVVQGLSELLLDDCGDALGDSGRQRLARIHASASKMADLINAMLRLSHASRSDVSRSDVDISGAAEEIVADLRRRDPDRVVRCEVQPGMTASADADLMCVLLENLIGNAWKYTARTDGARITVGARTDGDQVVFFVRDNGAGFDAAHGDSLFRPYQRLHSDTEFPGTGIGLATAHRVIERHGGRIWAESAVGEGATFYFTTG